MTFYQKVKRALGQHGPTTYAMLADRMEADAEAVRLQLHELQRRGQAKAERGRLHEEARLWTLKP